MQKSQTYDYGENDHTNRANMALICSQYFGIKDVSPSLYLLAAPVSEIAYTNKDGETVRYRSEIADAIPWNERSMRTFGVVYRRESAASFIGIDGRTYIVPNDRPVLEHLKECGYVIAPYGCNLDGGHGTDSLVFQEKDEDNFLVLDEIDRNLPIEIVSQIDKMEKGRKYYDGQQSYSDAIGFGTTFGLDTASEEELSELSLAERKAANIKVTHRGVQVPMDIDAYCELMLQGYYLNPENYPDSKKRT